ncbi:cytidine deaminase [Candidatus Peregrinibacteria bacterium]|nr:cytidine deaminase [Candidatus Peregrinibacteria bacterium]
MKKPKISKNPWLTDKEVAALIFVAGKTRQNAFCHRSKHKIGASVLTIDGQIFGGCNVESVISGLGTCAERCAIDNAVANGHYSFRALCCVDSKLTPCCGACLQYLTLFSQVIDDEVYLVNADTNGNFEVDKLSQALPFGYRTESNLEEIQSFNGKGKKHKKRP